MAESTATMSNHHPTIDPTSFDLIVSGTGLPESLIAAAASAAGKSVLHLDPNPFYGSHFSSLSPDSLASFLLDSSSSSAAEPSPSPSPHAAVDLEHRRLYSDVEIFGEVPEPASRSFLLDVAGPRVLYCADPVVDVMLKSGASHHVEFKSVESSLIYWEGRLRTVPDSREGIFKDKTLGLMEKSQMMRFLKLVKGHLEADGGGDEIPEEDLEIPFVEFLEKQRLPPKIKSIVLYAIAMADHDQDSPEDWGKLIKTKEGLESLSLYNSSVGRFPNAVGAFIYPIYGQGELPQAFCRCAAVKGTLYVLRMPVAGLLIDEENKQYKGVRLATGQDIFSHQLVMNPSFKVPSSFLSPDIQHGGPDGGNVAEVKYDSNLTMKVARMVCITKGSVQPDLSNVLVIFPPRSLYNEQITSVRALQLSSNVAVCPPGYFLMYLSTPCDNVGRGKEHLLAAMNALFVLPGLENAESLGTTNVNYEHSGMSDSEGMKESKPTLIWRAFYVQDLAQALLGSICFCPMPDGTLEYRNLLESIVKLFHYMHPQEIFFPETSPSDNNDEDGSSPE